MSKFWNFTKNHLSDGKTEVELRISGPIVDDNDVWLYEWFSEPCASPNNFRNELKQYTGSDIIVWIDSDGGSVFAATGMFNALMEHKKNGSKIIVKIEKAMSAATIPAMAGDQRYISPVGIFMMHNPLAMMRGYAYASELRKTADVLDIIKETIINAYQLGTGKTREDISFLMDDERYMSAKTAVEEGFATSILYDQKEGNDGNVVNFAFNRLDIINSANYSAKRLLALESKLKQSVQNNDINQNREDDKPMEFKNVEELRAAYPGLVKQIEDTAREAGVIAERERIKEIEEIGNTIADELVVKAKFEEPITAHALAFEALKADSTKGQEYLVNRKKEIGNSGSNDIKAGSESTMDDKTGEEAAINNIAAAANNKRGGKING